jgi:hypothetical protein
LFPVAAETTTGALHVRPPSIERLTTTAAPPTPDPVTSRAREEIIQTSWAASYATTGSLARSYGPGGSLWTVREGRKPLVQVRPPSRVVAKPMFDAPPSKQRPL